MPDLSHRFKVGDRVRVVADTGEDHHDFDIPLTGTIRAGARRSERTCVVLGDAPQHYTQVVDTADLKPIEPGRERLGCPRCGSLDLSSAHLSFESVEIFTDGHVEHNEGVTAHSPMVTISCDACSWSIGASAIALPAVQVDEFISAHADLIRAEFLKEVQA